MKLKYKKIILLTTLCTMGIGLLTLSISQGSPKAQEKNSTGKHVVAEAEEGDADSLTMSAMADTMDDNEDESATPVPTLSPTPIPTPTPIPIYPLEEMEGLDAFIEEFYIAKTAIDMDKLKSLYINPDRVESREQIQKMVQYIEDYRNVKTYTKKSFEEGAYIVYAYHEIKFSGINTLAPGLSKFYIITDDDGNFKIVSDMTPEVEEYFIARDGDEDVMELINSTNAKGEEAKAKDEDLMVFWNGLDELSKGTENQSEQDD
ncbi:MAG: hypothetical protein GX379_05810 [Clostridiales bacterium]|jgi:hypothetical protein|nr:hypothetical protein [Clostridiales bacterium]